MGLGLRGKAVKTHKFEFEFEVSSNKDSVSGSSKKSRSRKKTNIDGRRVLKKKSRYNVDGTFRRSRGGNKPPRVKKKVEPARKVRKNNPFRTDFEDFEAEEQQNLDNVGNSVEEKFDEYEFEDQVEKLKRERDELNNMPSKAQSNRHFDDDEDDLKAFETLENKLKFQDNDSALNRFNSTGNQSTVPFDDDEFIEEKFENEDSKFSINKDNSSSRFESVQGNPEFDQTTRLDKFKKKNEYEDYRYEQEEE